MKSLWRLPFALAVGAGIIALFGPGLQYLGSLLRGSQAPSVYSSRQSPNGSLVAESVEIGDGENGGRLVIRAKDGSTRSIELSEPPVHLFFRWKDDTHLELASYMPLVNLLKNDHLGEVNLDVRSYKFPDKLAYEGAGALKVAVPARDVAVTFARQATDSGQICVLKLGVARTPSFDAADVEITATVDTACQHHYSCLAINTRFTLKDSHEQGRQSTLTSASIANIRSYNRLPTGDQGTAVRGQFLGDNATRLVEALAKPSIALNFSRDFFEQVINYEMPLPDGAPTEFRQCVGNAQAL